MHNSNNGLAPDPHLCWGVKLETPALNRGQGLQQSTSSHVVCSRIWRHCSSGILLAQLYGIVTTLPEAAVWDNHMLVIEDQYQVVVWGFSWSVSALQHFLSMHLYVLQEQHSRIHLSATWETWQNHKCTDMEQMKDQYAPIKAIAKSMKHGMVMIGVHME